MSEEEIKKQLQQTDFIRFQIKLKELGEEKLLKQYTNEHVKEQQEDEQLQKFILDKSKQQQSTTGSKNSSKVKVQAEAHRRKAEPHKVVVSLNQV